MNNYQNIFTNDKSFEEKALAAFHFQAVNNPLYKKFIETLHTDVSSVKKITQIPFLPISFFKTHDVKLNDGKDYFIAFSSSGTEGKQSLHFVRDIQLYIESFSRSFEMFYGDIKDYCFLALLPSYLEREGSSLVYMCDDLIRKTNHPLSGFYLDDLETLYQQLQWLKAHNQKTILIGVTYALLDMAAQFPMEFPELIIMETGGMKGKRKEMIREEVHEILKGAFHVDKIHSEYGMTELLSQGWSHGDGLYQAPHWMRILVRNINDPMEVLEIGQGGINVIDLANIYSCPFIATQDLGTVHADFSFTVNGRFDNSDLRGCNLMIV